MKKTCFHSRSVVFILVLSGILITPSCTTPKKEAPPAKTVLGVFTPYGFFPETLNGKVKTVKEVNYWANDSAGSITTGDRITIADRDTFNWTNDILVSFDQQGNIEKCVFLNENDEPFGEWDVKMENGKMVKASWVANDTTKNYVDITHPSDNTMEMKRFDGQTDTLRNWSKIEMDQDGHVLSVQFFSAENTPQNQFNFKYDPDGMLENYSVTRDDTVRGGMNFQYNDEGFTQSQEVYSTASDERETYVYNYTYDDQGNWISYTGYKDGEPVVIAKRTYNYYPE